MNFAGMQFCEKGHLRKYVRTKFLLYCCFLIRSVTTSNYFYKVFLAVHQSLLTAFHKVNPVKTLGLIISMGFITDI